MNRRAPHPHPRRRWTTRCAILLLGVLASSAGSAQTTTAPVSQPAGLQLPTWVRVDGDRVNVRTRPDANSLPVIRLDRDALLRATGWEYGWFAVTPPAEVFVLASAEYIDRVAADRGIVSTGSGNLRVRAGSLLREVDPLQSEVVSLLPRGTEVVVKGEVDGWLRIAPPADVRLYIHADYAKPVTDAQAARLRATRAATTQPVDEQREVAATQPADEPVLTGPWGERLRIVESAIERESARPADARDYTDEIARLRPIAQQREQPAVARLAAAWIDQLADRIAELDRIRAAEELVRRAERAQARQDRERQRLREWKERAVDRGSVLRGELRASNATERAGGAPRYKLVDPLAVKTLAYLKRDPALDRRLETYVGRYVEIRGPRRSAAALGADVVRVQEIQVVGRSDPTSQPTRETD
jgi:hypothetical protein